MGVNAKIIKPYQVREFRQNHDVRKVKKQVNPTRVTSLKAFESVPVDPDPTKAASLSAFGKANRAQTPVKGIITGSYGEAAEQYFKNKQDETLVRVSDNF